MPFSRRLLCAAATVAALAFLPARAENKARSVELGAASTFFHFDSETRLANDFGWSGFVHYNFTTRHGAEIYYSDTTASPKNGPAFPVEATYWRAGYVYTTSRRERLLPYFRVGLGWWNFDVPDNNGTFIDRLEGDSDGYLIYSGGGVRIALADHFGIRVGAGVELPSVTGGLSHLDVQGTGEVGVYVRFGGNKAPEAPAEPADSKPATPPKEGSTEAKPPLP